MKECVDAILAAWNSMSTPKKEQPVFDENSDEKYPYCPTGRYFYLQKGKYRYHLYDLNYENDPQFVGQALAKTLKILHSIGGKLGYDVKNPKMLGKIMEDHSLVNYIEQV